MKPTPSTPLPSTTTWSQQKINLIILIIALIITANRIGFVNILPNYIGWLPTTAGDYNAYLINWLYFLNEPWTFPIVGKIQTIYYPFGTSIALTDTIPLFAIVFKFIGRLFSIHEFQFFGIFILINIYLMGLFTIKILKYYNIQKPLYLFSAAIITMTAPPLMYRIGLHFALTTQWFFVAMIYYYIQDFPASQHHKYLRNTIYFALLLIISSTIVTYYFVAIAFLFGLYILQLFPKNKKQSVYAFLVLIIALMLSFGLMYICGFFIINSQGASLAGFGIYSFNLNALWNPQGASTFLPAYPVAHGQYEGLSYLGFGIILVGIIISVLAFINRKKWHTTFYQIKQKCFSFKMILLTFFFLLNIIYAISNKIYFNQTLLLDLNLPPHILKYLNIFRVSGRYILVFYYPFIIGVFILWVKIVQKHQFAIYLVAALTIIQIVDIKPFFNYPEDNAYLNPEFNFVNFDAPYWQDLYQKHTITPLPPLECLYYATPSHWSYFAYLALQTKKTFNTSIVGRQDDSTKQIYIQNEIARIRNLSLQDTSEIFVLSKKFMFRNQQYDNQYLNYFVDIQNKFNILIKDEYYILFPKKEFFKIQPNAHLHL